MKCTWSVGSSEKSSGGFVITYRLLLASQLELVSLNLYNPMHNMPYDFNAATNRSPYLPASPNCASGPSYNEICPTLHLYCT